MFRQLLRRRVPSADVFRVSQGSLGVASSSVFPSPSSPLTAFSTFSSSASSSAVSSASSSCSPSKSSSLAPSPPFWPSRALVRFPAAPLSSSPSSPLSFSVQARTLPRPLCWMPFTLSSSSSSSSSTFSSASLQVPVQRLPLVRALSTLGHSNGNDRLMEAVERASRQAEADAKHGLDDEFKLDSSDDSDMTDGALFTEELVTKLSAKPSNSDIPAGVWWPEPMPGQVIPPRPRIRKIDELGRAYGAGGRKNAKAYCWIKPGTGKYVVNRVPSTEYFNEWSMRDLVIQPFTATGTLGQFDIFGYSMGGGKMGQAGALRQAISNALQNFDPRFRPTLKASGLLTRDSRIVERKHYGHKKARKSFTWVKR